MGTSVNFSSNYDGQLQLQTVARIEVQELRCQWKLKGLKSSFCFLSEVLDSPIFGGHSNIRYDPQHSWKLRWTKFMKKASISMSDELINIDNAFRLEVILEAVGGANFSSHKEINANCFVSLKEVEKESNNEVQFVNYKVGQTVHVMELFEGDLFNENNRYIVDDMLTINCRILIGPNVSPSYVIENETQSNKPLKRFGAAGRLIKTAMSTEFADMKLITGTKSFPVHRAILANKSPVFAAMFRSNMLETTNNSVVIQDVDEAVVKAMLEFIYTGQVTNLKDNVSDLFQISDKYEITELKEECEEFLISNLKVENVMKVWHLASLLNATALKVSAGQFIMQNKQKVSETEVFQRLAKTNPEVIIQFFLSI